jgi:hypothetical protein
MSLQIELEAAARFPAVTTAGRDYKAWAKRILYREAQGDKTLLSVQVKFAKEAMSRGLEQPE